MLPIFRTAAVLIFLSSNAFAQDRSKGMTAYLAEDWTTALQEFRPLAEQGNAAESSLGYVTPQKSEEAFYENMNKIDKVA